MMPETALSSMRWGTRNILELFGKPVLVIQLSPPHIFCPLLLSHVLLVYNLHAAHEVTLVTSVRCYTMQLCLHVSAVATVCDCMTGLYVKL